MFFLILLQCGFGIGLSSYNRVGPLLGVIGFSLLAWFLIEWMLFAIRVHFVLPKVRVTRTLKIGRRKVPLIWAGQEFDVCVDLVLNSQNSLPYLIFQDRPPTGCDRIEGIDHRTTSLQEGEIVGVKYRLKCDTPGEIRFEGVRIQMADMQGLFYHRTFLFNPALYSVLPPLSDAEGKRRGLKSHNVLPPPGVHRLRSAGGGSELHDLRDYRDGDPPKMIAWKTSARRDRLIVKEYESEIPIRCTILLDASQSVRIGVSRETMLNQLTILASAVAQAAFSDRDMVGLTVFDEHDVDVLRPNRNGRHLIELLNRLAKAGNAPVLSPAADIDSLAQLAAPLAHELYPDLMNRRSNSLPWSAFWEPMLDYSKARWVLLFCLPLLFVIGYIAAFGYAFCMEKDQTAQDLMEGFLDATEYLGEDGFWAVVIAILATGLFGILWWLGHGLSGQFPPWSTIRKRRKRLAALFCALDKAPPGMEARLIDDDAFMADRLQRFLSEHHRRYPVALYDEHGRYLFRGTEKVDVLAQTLVRAVAHGRDNELFVIMADLIELDGDLEPLFKAVRVAVGRHHQVLVICPWMPGVPVFPDDMPLKKRVKAAKKEARRQKFRGLDAQLFVETTLRYHAAHERVRRAFAKMGVMVIRAQQRDSVRLILNRMDQLRGVRARR